jgi:hypothetical protein
MLVVILGSGSDRVRSDDRMPEPHEVAAGEAATAIVRAVLVTPDVSLAITPGLAPMVAATALDLVLPSAAEEDSSPERSLSLYLIQGRPRNEETQQALQPFLDLLGSMGTGESIKLDDALAHAGLVFLLGNEPEELRLTKGSVGARVVYFSTLLSPERPAEQLRGELSHWFPSLVDGETLVAAAEGERAARGPALDDAYAAFVPFGLAAEAALEAAPDATPDASMVPMRVRG